MPSNWLAVGVETDPLRRARDLQGSWERLLADGALAPGLSPEATAGLRPTIVESWRRSLATGLDPTNSLAPIEADESEVLERWFEHPLGSLTHVLTEQLRKVAEESRGIVVVTDASGLVLYSMGDEGLKERAAEQNHLVEGARWSEAADGTNGIGTALAADHAFQVFAFEHFNERHHEWICAGAPVHDPVSGQTIGLIDLTNLWKSAHPRSLELVTTAARTIEQSLVDDRRDRDARLRRRYSDLMTRSTDLLVDRDGYVLDGAEPAHPSPFDIPEGGGEVVLGDGSVAVAAPLGRGEAYLLRHGTTRRAESPPAAKGLERAEERARELATEQAALRQVATLVAREASPDQLFAVVAEQVARVFDVQHVRLVRYEPDDWVVVGGFSEGDQEPFPIGSRWPLDGPGVAATVRRTGRPARIEDYAHLTGEVAGVVRAAGIRSTVASPIVVERLLWGAMVVSSPRHEPLPKDTEARLEDFTELVATAIANAESHAAVTRLVEEQAALRRVATLVARGAPSGEVFESVAGEVGRLFDTDITIVGRYDDDGMATAIGNWSSSPGGVPVGTRSAIGGRNLLTMVAETGEPARIDGYDDASGESAEIARRHGWRSSIAAPIVVEDRLWGVMLVATRRPEPFPAGAEERLAAFTDLVSTAVANAQSQDEVRRFGDEQGALRRVATLVAGGPGAGQLFAAVADEVQQLLGAEASAIVMYEDDGTVVTLGTHGGTYAPGTRTELDPDFVVASVRETQRAARFDTDDPEAADMPAIVREWGMRSAVASPIVVEGELWGAIVVASRRSLPQEAGARLGDFTDLVATAVANTQARQEVTALADEQAALRRVAVLVAQQPSPSEVFTAVTEAVGLLLDADLAVLHVFPGDGTATTVASWGVDGLTLPVGSRFPLDGDNLAARIFESGVPARMHSHEEAWESAATNLARSLRVRSAVGAPILVEGKLWGALMAATRRVEPWAENAETRIAAFTELVATAIANAESREARAVLTEEQAALRRVATLVAQGVRAEEIFSAVSEEVGLLLGTDLAAVGRFEDDPPSNVVVGLATSIEGLPIGSRMEFDDSMSAAHVYRTGRSARIDRSTVDQTKGEGASWLATASRVSSPIIVEGSLWGAISVASTDPLPPDAEQRLEKFTELVATAIANAEGKSELAASRTRIVAASDETRRQIERDLHDGTQQRLVSLGLEIRAAEASLSPERSDVRTRLSDVAEGLVDALEDLQEIARGIHPAILSKGGLAPALRTLAHRSTIPVNLKIAEDARLAEPIEVAAYFVASEALANAAKHSQASRIDVSLTERNGRLLLSVRDDGVGGADPTLGSGLVGLTDRVEALGGSISVDSRRGNGTRVAVELPTELDLPQPAS